MRAEKKSIVDQIREKLERSTMFVLTDHTGLSAVQLDELRALLRKGGSDFMVIKNRLFLRALEGDCAEEIGREIKGPTSIALGTGDCAVLSKIITDFAKQNKAPAIKGGYMEGAILSAAEVGVIASLPSRDVLIARLMRGMGGAVSGFAGVMREMIRQFVSVLDQISKRGGEE